MNTIKHILKKFLFLHYSICLKFRRRPFKYLLIMAHMRSGSTLLSHLLNTNRNVYAAAESNEIYSSMRDLKRQIYRVFCVNRMLFPRGAYVADQLNHSRLIPDPALLDDERIYCLFLIREPREALSSILRLEYFRGTEDDALTYYADRLEKLCTCAERLGDKGRMMFITHRQLLDQTADVLSSLQRFTGLETPFSEQYSVLHITGKVSDPSRTIKEGRVVRNSAPPPMQLKKETIERAESVYRKTLDRLSGICITIYHE